MKPLSKFGKACSSFLKQIFQELAEYFSGNEILPGSKVAAHCYCGHQFGAFSGQLGDGAAMYLGDVINSKNERWEMQIKGAGPTPYSRYSYYYAKQRELLLFDMDCP